jgi:hypothetical protein
MIKYVPWIVAGNAIVLAVVFFALWMTSGLESERKYNELKAKHLKNIETIEWHQKNLAEIERLMRAREEIIKSSEDMKRRVNDLNK